MLLWWNPFNPSKKLDEVFTHNYMALMSLKNRSCVKASMILTRVVRFYNGFFDQKNHGLFGFFSFLNIKLFINILISILYHLKLVSLLIIIVYIMYII